MWQVVYTHGIWNTHLSWLTHSFVLVFKVDSLFKIEPMLCYACCHFALKTTKISTKKSGPMHMCTAIPEKFYKNSKTKKITWCGRRKLFHCSTQKCILLLLHALNRRLAFVKSIITDNRPKPILNHDYSTENNVKRQMIHSIHAI